MCGRYTLTAPVDAVRRYFGVSGPVPNLYPRYNLAPTQDAPVIGLAQGGQREFRMMRWGLVPGWAKDAAIGARMINARIETLSEKPAFRQAYRKRRCLVPADGFFEWRVSEASPAGGDAGKEPLLIRRADRSVFAFAGLWEAWAGPDGQGLRSFTIVTAPASPFLARFHHRMPVMLDEAGGARWLDPDAKAPAAILRDHFLADEMLEAVPVSRRVNRPAHDDPGVLDPVGPALRAAA